MLKLYKRIGDVLHYHEAWANDAEVIEHWGSVGARGQLREHPLQKGQSAEEAVESLLQPRLLEGYLPIAEEDHATLLIEYPVAHMGTNQDLDKRHALEDRMNETLGWTGLGACDGGSIGSGTMEVCCFVVDFEVAQRVIAEDLKETEFGDYSRIYDENA
ncbi:hypothetical protein [Ideonella sp.]|jgi:hypothetical protein|uniref:hypothetical protein n=1 Tax=Ideonella sp. TaxID=1929293 RepID=UPI0037C06D59